MKKVLVAALLLFAGFISLSQSGFACSLVMKTNKQGTFVGRTMEWFTPLKTRIEIYPRNYANQDAITGHKWNSKYGVIVIDEGKIDETKREIAVEGINEKGLTAHTLFHGDAEMTPLDPKKTKIHFLVWVKYVLQTSSTVKEVLDDLKNYQILYTDPVLMGKQVHAPEHFAVNDASGDAAIIEFVNGKMQVFHGPEYNVMTNEPNLTEQLANLKKVKQENKQYSVSELPGGAASKNRFVRLSFFMDSMPQPNSPSQGVAYMEEALDGVTVPAFDEKKYPNSPLSDAWEGRWRIVYDLANLNLYFTETTSGKKVFLKLKDVDFGGNAIKYIELKDIKSDYDL